MIAILSLWLVFQAAPDLKQHVEAGLAAKRVGDLDTAIREFRRVAELAPGLAAAHVNLGAVYVAKKDYGNAVPSLKKAIELNSDLPGAEEMLGIALLAQGYAAEAVPHLEKVNVKGLLGIALYESGRTRDAIDALEAALKDKPGNTDLLYYLSQAHGRLSKQLLDTLLSDRDSPRAQQLLGELAVASGNREAAEKHFQAALKTREDLQGIHLALGELYFNAGDYPQAEQEFRAEVEQRPGSAVAAYRLGLVLLNRGELKTSLAELRRADSLQTGMPETLLALGKVSAALNDDAAAEGYFKQVLQHEQDSGIAETAHFQLSQVYRKTGRDADAVRELQQFQKIRNARR